MSFARVIQTYENKSAKQRAKETNERRRQSQAWLRRNENKKMPSVTSDKKN